MWARREEQSSKDTFFADHSSRRRASRTKVGFLGCHASAAQINVGTPGKGWAKRLILGNIQETWRGAVSRRIIFTDHSSNRQASTTQVGFMGCHGSGASNGVGASRKSWVEGGIPGGNVGKKEKDSLAGSRFYRLLVEEAS